MSTQHPLVTLKNTEVQFLQSSIVNDTYKLQICLPQDYEKVDARYPVVYVNDFNYMSSLLWHIVFYMSISLEVPQLIIVGIGYDTDNREQSYQPWWRDLVDARSSIGEEPWRKYAAGADDEGKAGNFLRFIREELKPFINTTYRTITNDSVYGGFSLGGVFGLYVLFHYPETFNRYIIGSPSIGLHNRWAMEYEKNYATENDDLSARVFMSVGAREELDDPFVDASLKEVTNMKTLAKSLEKRQYASLQLTTHVFENETHLSVIPATLSRGLRVVFE
jgi:predicted alpha/beta superfamily hydrolase